MASPELPGTPEIAETDVELTRRALGALGLYDASQDVYNDPDHNDSIWVSVN